MKNIESIQVYLDDNIPEYMSGIIRIGSVTINFDDGSYGDYDRLVDNAEFNTLNSYDSAIIEMKNYIISNLYKYIDEDEIDISNLTRDIVDIYED